MEEEGSHLEGAYNVSMWFVMPRPPPKKKEHRLVKVTLIFHI